MSIVAAYLAGVGAGRAPSDPMTPPPEPDPATAVSDWDYDETSGTALADSVNGITAAAFGTVSLGEDPLVSDAGKSIALNGTNAYISAPTAAAWRNAAYSVTGRFQLSRVTSSLQQVIAAMDRGQAVSLPPGGWALDTVGAELHFYSRVAGGGGGSAWWMGETEAGTARPVSGVATIVVDTAYLWAVRVDPDAGSDNTSLWLWKAGDSAPSSPIATTDNTEGLASNDAGLFIGAYPTATAATAHMEGAVDAVAIRNGVLSQSQFAALGAPTSITISGAAEPTSDIPTSLSEVADVAGAAVTIEVDVAEGAGFDHNNLSDALDAAVAGDVIAVKGSSGNYIYYEPIDLSGKRATEGSPIKVIGWTPDGNQPEISVEVETHPTWTLSNGSLGIYSGTVPAANGFAYGYLPEAEGDWQLFNHINGQSSFELTGERYTGPSMFASGTSVRIRTQTDQRQSVRLVPDGKITTALPVEKNPSNWSGFRFSVHNDYGFKFSDCAHIHFKWLNWFGGKHGVLLTNNTTGLRFYNGWLRYARYGVLFGRPSGSSDPVASSCLFDRFEWRQFLPPWLARDDYKADSSSNGASRSMSGFNECAVYVRGGNNLEISNSIFWYPSDILQVGLSQSHTVHIHHCLGVGSKDDTMQATVSCYNIDLHHNVFLGFAGPGHGASDGAAPVDKQSQVYLHHNVIDVGHAPYELGLISFGRNTSSGQPEPFAYGNERARGAHDTPNLPMNYRTWNNTFICRDERGDGSNIGMLYGDSAARVPTGEDRAHEVWNTFLGSPTDSVLLGSSIGDVIDHHPSVSNNTPVEMMDGCMLSKASGSANIFRQLTKLTGGTVRSNYASLAAYIAGSPHYAASEDTEKYPESPHRWNGNSIEADPLLGGVAITSLTSFTLDAFGKFQIPADWSMYVPANTDCEDQGVDISGRWGGLSAPDGPNDRTGIEESRTRFYIGAIDPVTDPNGTAVGVQNP